MFEMKSYKKLRHVCLFVCNDFKAATWILIKAVTFRTSIRTRQRMPTSVKT